MENLTNIVNDRQKQYDSLNPLKINNLAPREGYYLILSTSKELISNVDCTVATVLWKYERTDKFIKYFHQKVQLKSLLGLEAVGPKLMLNRNINGLILHVKAVKIVSVGNTKKFKVDWDFVKEPINYHEASAYIKNREDVLEDFDNGDDPESDIINAIQSQISEDESVMHAILMMEDDMYAEYDYENDLIAVLEAQDLPK